MASVSAKIPTVLHKSFMEKWKSASSDSPKKFTRKEIGPSKRTSKGTLPLYHCCLFCFFLSFFKTAQNSPLVIYGMTFFHYILKFHSKDLFSQKCIQNLLEISSQGNLYFDRWNIRSNIYNIFRIISSVIK